MKYIKGWEWLLVVAVVVNLLLAFLGIVFGSRTFVWGTNLGVGLWCSYVLGVTIKKNMDKEKADQIKRNYENHP